jgi:hypothetical protein
MMSVRTAFQEFAQLGCHLECGIGSSVLNAEPNAFERLQIVRERNSWYLGSKHIYSAGKMLRSFEFILDERFIDTVASFAVGKYARIVASVAELAAARFIDLGEGSSQNERAGKPCLRNRPDRLFSWTIMLAALQSAKLVRDQMGLLVGVGPCDGTANAEGKNQGQDCGEKKLALHTNLQFLSY